MNNRKATKRALLTSVMALVMCVVMLVGTTFAWFTDTARASVNTIKAGNLKVGMVDESGAPLVGKTLSWQKADEGKSQEVLWEPGATYDLEAFRIVNTGNLALKYEITVNGVKGSSKLLKAIDFTAKMGNDVVELDKLTGAILPKGATANDPTKEVVEQTDLITISGTMRTDAGNEYQGLTIDGVSITVVATQYTYEYDSKDNQYDADAKAEINVNASNIQDYLDGKYGSIDGMTLVLAEGDYGQLELGRATKYAGSNTQYRIGSFDANPMTFEAFYTRKTDGTWSDKPVYTRSMSNVTFKAAGTGVNIAGIKMSSGFISGTAAAPAYDYVLDREVENTTKGYTLAQHVNNITFDGINFTAKSNITTSQAETIINGFTFTGCTFDLGYTETTHSSAYIALCYYNENGNGNVSNLVVDKCEFKNCSQGVYTGKVVNVSVTNSKFNTTSHNAIAVQTADDPCNHGAVVITDNKFDTIGADAIRFGHVGADTQITIKDNTATNIAAGRKAIRAESIVDGITYDISNNNWGGARVSHAEFGDK